jgi:hypothetical protein
MPTVIFGESPRLRRAAEICCSPPKVVYTAAAIHITVADTVVRFRNYLPIIGFEAFMGNCLKKTIGLILGILICLQVGCMGPAMIPSSSPSWHQQKSGSYDTPAGRYFYGIGRAGGAQNLMLLRATADNRARKELAGVLERYVMELARSVPGNLDPNWASLSAGERRQILGTVVRKAMQRAVVCDHWNEPRETGMLSLCRLGLSDFKMVLSGSGALNEPMRSAMVSGAEKVHARLARKL